MYPVNEFVDAHHQTTSLAVFHLIKSERQRGECDPTTYGKSDYSGTRPKKI